MIYTVINSQKDSLPNMLKTF